MPGNACTLTLILSAMPSKIRLNFGSGLLSITGTSFAFITPIILAGKTRGLSLVFGMSLSMAVVPLVLAPFLPRLQRAFSPVVAGTVVLLIGLLLIPTSMFGIQTPLPGEHLPATGLLAAGVVLALVVIFNALRLSWAKLAAALLALLGGCLLCLLVGGVKAPDTGGAWFALPQPLKYGLSFDAGFILPFGFCRRVPNSPANPPAGRCTGGGCAAGYSRTG